MTKYNEGVCERKEKPPEDWPMPPEKKKKGEKDQINIAGPSSEQVEGAWPVPYPLADGWRLEGADAPCFSTGSFTF